MSKLTDIFNTVAPVEHVRSGGDPEAILAAMRTGAVLALGRAAAAGPDVLEVFEQGVHLLPVWTRPDALESALHHRPELQTLETMAIPGADLLDRVRKGVVVVLNPWSKWEFRLHPG